MTNHMESISHHIMPLAINSLGGRTHTQTHMHTDIRGQKQETMHAWFKNNKILFLQYTTCDKEYVMATRMPNPIRFYYT